MKLSDVWAAGDAYEPYVGRWSRLVARELLSRLSVGTGARWLDVGCGTGALTETIIAAAEPAAVVGVDASAGFVEYARQHVRDPRVRFDVADARTLPCAAGEFDAVVSGLVLNFVPEPQAAVVEMARVGRSGGTIGAYVWDYADGMQMMRHFWAAAAALNPTTRELDEGVRFAHVCHPEALETLWRKAGLTGVAAHAIDVETEFRDFDDYWSPFLGGQGPAPSYAVTLTESERVALRERIRSQLPIAADGTIRLIARAWAVHGIR